jgi:DNA-binding CsgD family transcriptional regulator
MATVRLSKRQSEVLDLVKAGKSRSEICRALGLRKNTVTRHLKRVFRKTGWSKRDLIAGLSCPGQDAHLARRAA